MARNRSTTLPPGDESGEGGPEGMFEPDPFTEQERRQAEVGTLFSIQGPQFQDVSWSIFRYRTKTELAQDPNGKPEEWVADSSGELKGAELMETLGGGTFHFYGYIPRAMGGVQLKYNRVITLAGQRKNFSGEAPVTPAGTTVAAVASPSGSQTDRLIRVLLREQREARAQMARLIEAMANRGSGGGSMVEMVTALKALHDIAPAQAHVPRESNPLELAKTMLDSFHQGVTLGQARDPIAADDATPNYMPVIEKGLEIFNSMLTRQRQRPPGAPPPPPRSSAAVVEDPPVTTPPATPAAASTPEHRWSTAIEALYRAMLNGRDPADFADSLADMLNPDELDMIRPATADQVLTYLAPVVANYPGIANEQGRVYLTSVLNALRSADDDEPEDAEVVK